MTSATLPHGGFFKMSDELVREMLPRHYLSFVTQIDLTAIEADREAARRRGRTPASYTAYVVHAVAQALAEHPQLNCMIRERPFGRVLLPLEEITATVAIEREIDGIDMVLAAQIRSVDMLSPESIAGELRTFADDDVVDKPVVQDFLRIAKLARYLPTLAGWLVRMPRLSKRLWQKYRGGSFAVTSPGKYGGCDIVVPPWPWPLCAGFGKVALRPVVIDGNVVARKTVFLTLVADRRLANGAPLARFAEDVRGNLERRGQQAKVALVQSAKKSA